MTQFLAYCLTALVGSLIARKFKTREKAEAVFAKMELDWISGIGLAIVIVIGGALGLNWMFGRH